MNQMSRLSHVPTLKVDVLRDGQKTLVEAKEIVVADVVFLDSKVGGIIPADILLIETDGTEDFVISSYLEAFDSSNKHLKHLRTEGVSIPESATKKVANFIPNNTPSPEEIDSYPELILDSPVFVPKGAKLYSGSGYGICIRIGNNTI